MRILKLFLDVGPHGIFVLQSFHEMWFSRYEHSVSGTSICIHLPSFLGFRFAPGLCCVTYAGDKEERAHLQQDLKQELRFHVLLTTYEVPVHFSVVCIPNLGLCKLYTLLTSKFLESRHFSAKSTFFSFLKIVIKRSEGSLCFNSDRYHPPPSWWIRGGASQGGGVCVSCWLMKGRQAGKCCGPVNWRVGMKQHLSLVF